MQQTASATPSRQERRVRRTRAMILAGFIQLMQQKPVKDISVRELADLVDINRSTFYLHYTDIYDLLEQTENGLMDQFLAIIDKNHANLTLQEFSDKDWIQTFPKLPSMPGTDEPERRHCLCSET